MMLIARFILVTPRPAGTTCQRFGGNSEDRKSLIDGMLVTNDQDEADRFPRTGDVPDPRQAWPVIGFVGACWVMPAQVPQTPRKLTFSIRPPALRPYEAQQANNFVNLRAFSSSKGIWMSLRWRSMTSITRWPRWAHPPRTIIFNCCFG